VFSVIATAGCGCAPAVVVRWGVVGALVVAALVLGAVALVLVGRRRARRALDGAGESPTDGRGSGGGDGLQRRRARPELTAAVLLVIAVVVAAAHLSSTLSLLGLAVGALAASVGMGATPSRHRADDPRPPETTASAGRSEGGPSA